MGYAKYTKHKKKIIKNKKMKKNIGNKCFQHVLKTAQKIKIIPPKKQTNNHQKQNRNKNVLTIRVENRPKTKKTEETNKNENKRKQIKKLFSARVENSTKTKTN